MEGKLKVDRAEGGRREKLASQRALLMPEVGNLVIQFASRVYLDRFCSYLSINLRIPIRYRE